MLIGGDDISDDIITRGTCLLWRSLLCRADWQKSDSSVDGEQHGYWKWNSNYRDVFESSPSFSRTTAGAPGELASRPAKKTPTVFGIEVTKVWDVGLS